MKTNTLLLFTYCVWFFVLHACNQKEEKKELAQHQLYHTFTLDFEGPQTAESAEDNPFLNYKLVVEFNNADTKYSVRGFYAADGNAAESSSDAGNIWRVRFTPDKLGEWNYKVRLFHGDSIAISNNANSEVMQIPNPTGKFLVIPSDKQGSDFRAKGHLEAYNGYFRFKNSKEYWIKGGANSPENFLAYVDFDSTYRMTATSRKGEASTNEEVHTYAPHLEDWKEGDPSWQNGKGKSIIGAINYLASKGMNVVYFLTLNIKGDGRDVWPYRTPTDFTRFDVSKLDQWEILFEHMQSRGIHLHVVLQETENETMLDSGNTGPLRQLYFSELIARFGHHLALNWNLGEENGPAHFSPIGQDDRQRKDMISFIKGNDPYNHPVLLHTHAVDPERSDILEEILDFGQLDGLSLQAAKREGAAEVVQTWKDKSRDAGNPWAITMDEIGMWHTGARSDSLDGNHETLRRFVLWGTLMSGGAGVEWYFGARSKHNDLAAEDWRTRDRLWELTDNALAFFQTHLPYWEMTPEHHLAQSEGAYCFKKLGEVYAIYFPVDTKNFQVDLSEESGKFSLQWYNSLKGGELMQGSEKTISGGAMVDLGNPPNTGELQDWVALLKKSTTQ
ncbi:MAG: DUF5060 domain-containing protein [Cyclobacteriaceae bacterium]